VGTLRVDRRGRGVARAREREEEGVALRVDLDSLARPERLADDAPVLGDQVRVAVAEPFQEPGRALDVAEHERDCSGRED
jgi:hypothetical protein